jgi:uncharacterized membrane protein
MKPSKTGMPSENKANRGLIDSDSERLMGHISAFSNAVFAFAITLLILDIKVPAGTNKADLAATLLSMWPNYLAFLLSFFVIGMYWLAYIRMLRETVHVDRNFIWLNLLFLLFIVIIPFSTNLISVYLSELTVILYAALMACAGFIHSFMRIYACNHQLVAEKYSALHIRKGITISFVSPVCFTLSIGIAFINSLAAQLSWILIFVLHIIIGRLPRFKNID